MPVPAPPPLWRSLGRLRRQGRALGAAELAQELLALRPPVEAGVARRLLAAALGCPPFALPEPIPARLLRPAEEAGLAELSLGEARFAVVDLETSGLDAERCAILEIGAVRVAGLARRERFATLIRPAGKVPARIQDLTGISPTLLAGAPPPRRALVRFRRWLERGAPAPFVAHNAAFDARFLARAFEEHGLPPYRAPLLCTQRLARRLLPALGRYNLDHLCAHFGISNADRHRGPGDAEATARALIELLAIAHSRHGVDTLGGLLDLQEQPLLRRRRRRPPDGPRHDFVIR